MIKKIINTIYILFIAVLTTQSHSFAQMNYSDKITGYDINLYDTARHRQIPVAIYAPDSHVKDAKVIIFSHGYDKNAGGSYKAYSYLTESLAACGYFVISIQHELPDDDLLAMEGDLYLNRLPNWNRGVGNIYFTFNEFRKIRPDLDWSNVALAGHSNGGDMSMLFATRYPGLIKKVISLDHRRMPVPRTCNPRVYTIRGCDYEADRGVLPTAEEQKTYFVRVVKLAGIKHSEMDNKGSEIQKNKICRAVLEFLNE